MEQIYGSLILIGPGVLAWQAYSWLRTGVWTALPVSKTFQYFECPIPSTAWLGVQKIVDWVFDIPTSVAIFAVSFVFVVILAMIEAVIGNYRANRGRT